MQSANCSYHGPCEANRTNTSLLDRVQHGDDDAWQLLVAIYEPMMRDWLRRFGVPSQEIDDLTQDVLALMLRGISAFEHRGQTGAFRCWLRTLTINRARTFWRQGRGRPKASVPLDLHEMAQQLEDPQSDLTRRWDAEHDQYVLRYCLRRLHEELEPQTIRAFELWVVEGQSIRQVSQALGMTTVAIYGAKARVLARLREMAAMLLDFSSDSTGVACS